jgi:PAS domain S-box-containing protein
MVRFRRFDDLPIRHKLLLGYSVLFLVSLALVGLALHILLSRVIQKNIDEELKYSTEGILRTVRTSVGMSIRNHLRGIAEKNRDIAMDYTRQVNSGKITREEAMNQLRRIFQAQTIGDSGYIYVLDVANAPKQVTLVTHPKLGHINVAQEPFVQQILQMRHGYVEYDWANPGELQLRHKTVYFVELKPWNWIIAVSAYQDELHDLFNVDDLRKDLLRMKLMRTGYPVVFDTQGNMVIHPYLSGKHLFSLDTLNARLARRVIAQREGLVDYKWKDPGSDSLRDKLMMLAYYPEMNWIVASSVYLDEYQKPLRTLNRILILSLLVTTGLVLTLSLYLGTSITRPIRILAEHLKHGEQTGESIRMTVSSQDEVGQLAEYFNSYMERLDYVTNELRTEIQERIHIAHNLARSERRFRNILETAAEAFIETDTDFRIVFVNPEAERLMQRPATELIGLVIADLTDTDGYTVFSQQIEYRRTGEKGSYENRLRRMDGTFVECLFNASPLFNDQGEYSGSFAMITDITQRKMMERENAEVRRYLDIVINSLNAGLVAIDSHGRTIRWNQRLSEYIGLSQDEASGLPVWEAIPCLAPFQDEILNLHEKQGSISFQLRCEINGSPSFLSATVNPIESPHSDGAVILLEDITELKRKDEQLQQAQKMELIGNLSGGLAHDFNNILTGITGTVSLMKLYKSQPSGKPPQYDKLIEILDISAQRATRIVKHLLTLARKNPLSISEFDLRHSIANTIEMCHTTFDRCVEIQWTPPETPCPTLGDSTQIEQILLNLCLNAYHAMTIMRPDSATQGGLLTLDLHRVVVDASFRYAHLEATEDHYWRISVIDTGVGIDPHHMRRMFEPFFTTKDKGVGSGLGLSMVYSILKQHRGFIDVYSQVGVGSTFNVYLPEKAGVIEGHPDDLAETEVIRGYGRILIVDDEPLMQEVARSILTECGYSVTIASDGEEAVDIFTREPDSFRAVLWTCPCRGVRGWRRICGCVRFVRKFVCSLLRGIVRINGLPWPWNPVLRRSFRNRSLCMNWPGGLRVSCLRIRLPELTGLTP